MEVLPKCPQRCIWLSGMEWWLHQEVKQRLKVDESMYDNNLRQCFQSLLSGSAVEDERLLHRAI